MNLFFLWEILLSEIGPGLSFGGSEKRVPGVWITFFHSVSNTVLSPSSSPGSGFRCIHRNTLINDQERSFLLITFKFYKPRSTRFVSIRFNNGIPGPVETMVTGAMKWWRQMQVADNLQKQHPLTSKLHLTNHHISTISLMRSYKYVLNS